MTFRKEDAQRALELLTRLNNKLADGVDKSLKSSMECLISVLGSDLFNSLIDIQEYYRQLLGSDPNSSSLERREESHDNQKYNSVSIASDSAARQSPSREGTLSPGEPSDWEYAEVVISRPPGQNMSFGFTIAGGYDAPQENGDPSIYITRLAPNGIAERDNRLRPFDQIISVNGTDLTYVANREAVEILKKSGDTLAMIIRRYTGPVQTDEEPNTLSPKDNGGNVSNDDYYYEVNLVKPASNVGLGFTIAGGQMAEGYSEGIYVTKITPGGLAERDGSIQPGDRLIQVNGQDLSNVTHDEAVQCLRNAGTHVHIVLLRTRYSMTFSGTISPSIASDGTLRK